MTSALGSSTRFGQCTKHSMFPRCVCLRERFIKRSFRAAAIYCIMCFTLFTKYSTLFYCFNDLFQFYFSKSAITILDP